MEHREDKMKKVITGLLGLLLVFAVMGCDRPADVVSRNISLEADNFNVLRRVVFINGITDQYLMSIEGFCSLGNDRSDWEISITCKVGGTEYKKHFLGLSDNVTYFVEQLESANVDPNHYKVIFRPSVLIPSLEVK